MKSTGTARKTIEQENAALRIRLAEAEETLRAIHAGEVDALVMAGEVYTMQTAETPYRLLVETMNEGAATVIEDGTVLYANRRLAELLRTPLQALIGSSLRRFVSASNLAAFDAMLALDVREARACSMAFICPNNVRVPVQLSCSPLRTAGAHTLCLVATDLTELETSAHSIARLQEHQEALEASQAKLRESEARFRTLADAAFEGIAILQQNRFVDVNEPLLRILGTSRAELIGRELADILGPEDRVRVLLHTRSDEESHLEYGMLRSDGSRIIVETHVRTLMLQGRRAHIVALRDITTRKRMEQAVTAANERLKMVNEEMEATNEDLRARTEELRGANDAVKLRNRELAKMSEELRANNEQLEQRVVERTAQLRALAGELIQSEERERRRIAQILHDHLQQLLVGARLHLNALRENKLSGLIQRDVKRVDQLLSDSIEVARGLSHELSPLVLHEEGLGASLKWLTEWMREHHNLAVRIVAKTQAEPADENAKVLLFQSVRELLFNVVKHAGVSRALLRIAKGSQDDLEIVVSDKGRGFDPVRAKSGFGLFSIRERLQLLGGRMEVDSARGRGSRFLLCAPLRESGDPSAAAKTPSRAPVLTRPRRGSRGRSAGDAKIRVLLADDHKVVRDGLSALLSEQPEIEVIGVAADGHEALQQAKKLQPDVVVMDLSMPGMDGVEATRQIAAAWPHVRVLGLTMHADPYRHDLMCKAGATKCLIKSGPTQELIRAIRAACPIAGKERPGR